MAYYAHRGMIRTKLLLQLHLPRLCSFCAILFASLQSRYTISWFPPPRTSLLPLAPLLLFFLKDAIQVSSHSGSRPGLTYAGWLGCLVSAPKEPSLAPSEHLLFCINNVFSPLLYCESLEGKSSLSYLKPQEQAQCLVYNTLKC